MNVVSLELCKELYELSGWNDTHNTWKRLTTLDMTRWKDWYLADFNNEVWNGTGEQSIPAYDLGYLLRKLPNYIEYWDGGNEAGYLQLIHWSTHWSCGYEDVQGSDKSIMVHLNDTPEDAAARLAIELFKQKVLVTEKDFGTPTKENDRV